MSALDTMLGLGDERPVVLPVDHLSASQIGMYQRCREQYRRRYVLGEKERPGAALVWGAADHYAHEQNWLQKIESHQDIPVADVELAFAEGFDRAVERNGGESEVDWGQEKPADMKDAGVRLVNAYHTLVSPSVQPTAVEREFSLTVPGVPVPVVGRIDLETAGPGIERKTGKKAESRPKPQWRLQGLIYQLEHGRSVDFHLSVKKKLPEVVTPETNQQMTLPYVPGMARMAESMIRHTAMSIAADYATFGPDEPWQGAITHDWACNFCGFYKTCPWWAN